MLNSISTPNAGKDGLMTAERTAPAAPPWAVTAWVTEEYVFVELPGRIPYVMKFPLSEGGLSKALNILRIRHTEALAPVYVEPKFTASNRLGTVGTPNQRAAAAEALRKLGIVR